MKPALFCVVIATLAACSSAPEAVEAPSQAPNWVHQPTRTMDNGYIVYVARGEDESPEKAAFKAEALAIGDLSNECSFAPKGARIEDRYDFVAEGVHHSYAKIGLTFEECEGAKQAVEPDAIRKLANTAMAEQWKKYQDLYYTTDQAPGAEGQVPAEQEFVAANSTPDYFILRQQVAVVKQQVILAPVGAYPPGAPQTQILVTRLAPAANQIRFYERSNPAVAATRLGWSGVHRDPGVRSGYGGFHPASRASRPEFDRGRSHPGSFQPGFRRGGGFHGGRRR